MSISLFKYMSEISIALKIISLVKSLPLRRRAFSAHTRTVKRYVEEDMNRELLIFCAVQVRNRRSSYGTTTYPACKEILDVLAEKSLSLARKKSL